MNKTAELIDKAGLLMNIVVLFTYMVALLINIAALLTDMVTMSGNKMAAKAARESG